MSNINGRNRNENLMPYLIVQGIEWYVFFKNIIYLAGKVTRILLKILQDTSCNAIYF